MYKVAYLLGSLNRGGTETLLLDVMQKARPFEAFLYYRKSGGALECDFQKTSVLTSRLTPRFPFDPIYLYILRRNMQKMGVQIVHAQQYLDAIYAKIALLGLGIKIVQTYHGYDYGQSAKGNAMIRWIAHRIDKNIFVSHTQKGYFQKNLHLPIEKVEVVYNGVNFDKLKDRESKNNIKLQIGTVGNFVRGRDQLTLCLFLKRLHDAKVDFDFYFVGGRNEKEPWRYDNCVHYCQEQGVMDKVHFMGVRNDVPDLLAKWDVFLYSTDHDTFGIAVVEAMAAGVPVFVNDWEVMKEVTKNGEWATLYETKNVDDLYEKFLVFLQQKSTMLQQAEANASKVRNAYSIEHHIDALHQLYQKVLNQ